MTDPHDLEPHDQTEGHAHEDGHEHEQGQAETGAWEGAEPPVSGFGDEGDDFGDTAEAGEAASVTDEHAADEHGGPLPDDGLDGAATDKKRNLLLPAAAVGGGLLILAAVLFWQFGGSHPPDRIPMQMTALPPAAAPAPAEPTMVSAPSDLPAEPVAPKTAMVAPTVAAPTVAMPPPMVVPADTAVPAAASSANTAAASSASAAAASAAAASATEARLTTLSGRMDDMQHSIEQAMLKLTQVSDRLATQAAAPGVAAPAAPSPELESRLTKIEQRLAQIGQAPTRHSSMAAMSEDDHLTARSASHHHKPHMPARTAQLTSRKPHHKAMATDDTPTDLPEPTGGNRNWVLRAASPDEAWVAKDDTTTELRAVHIGDSLPGVGRITAIRDQGGVWVLQGAQGAVQ